MCWGKAKKKLVIIEFREVEPELYQVMSDGTTRIDVEVIKTREGTLYGYAGKDYIIRGVEGELYPIDKAIFEKTYDVIECPEWKPEYSTHGSEV